MDQTDKVEIEVYDWDNHFLGDSPIVAEDIVDISWDDALCELGEFSFRVPANNVHREHLMDIKNHIRLFAYVVNQVTGIVTRRRVYDGQITNPFVMIGQDGVPYIECRGIALASELAETICHTNFLRQEYPYTAPAYVLGVYNDWVSQENRWLLDPEGEQTTVYDVGQLKTDHKISYFEFLREIADYTRSCFCLLPGRKIRWFNQTYRSSPLHACYLDFYDKDDLPEDTLPIKSLTVEQVSNTVISSVFAHGNSSYPEWLDVDWQPGYPWTVRLVDWITILENRETIDAYGEHQVYKEFAQAGSQEALQRLAQNYLLNNNAPQHVYSLEVANLTPGSIYPGDVIRVDYDGVDDTGRYLSIHEDLVLISASHTIDPSTKLYSGTLSLSEKVTQILDNGDIIQQLTARLTDAHANG